MRAVVLQSEKDRAQVRSREAGFEAFAAQLNDLRRRIELDRASIELSVAALNVAIAKANNPTADPTAVMPGGELLGTFSQKQIDGLKSENGGAFREDSLRGTSPHSGSAGVQLGIAAATASLSNHHNNNNAVSSGGTGGTAGNTTTTTAVSAALLGAAQSLLTALQTSILRTKLPPLPTVPTLNGTVNETPRLPLHNLPHQPTNSSSPAPSVRVLPPITPAGIEPSITPTIATAAPAQPVSMSTTTLVTHTTTTTATTTATTSAGPTSLSRPNSSLARPSFMPGFAATVPVNPAYTRHSSSGGGARPSLSMKASTDNKLLSVPGGASTPTVTVLVNVSNNTDGTSSVKASPSAVGSTGGNSGGIQTVPESPMGMDFNFPPLTMDMISSKCLTEAQHWSFSVWEYGTDELVALCKTFFVKYNLPQLFKIPK